ncbi:DNA primase large subunit-like [Penaeus japonicus]|uniref:DNA primase large subunit-like n=1 Tax=Penaeus japonicus TaxID=27405 RepID=UPI001C70E4A7|nr:DNA primase large subunit-like [Penaeus japonicus]
MTFYIKPPQGTVSLHKLREDAEVRLRYLIQINQHWGDATRISGILTDDPSLASKSECLIEGSRKDQISHFVLRLACVESSQLKHFFTEAETQLFDYRLKCGGAQTIVRCLNGLKRHTQHSLKYQKLSLSHETWLREQLRITRRIIASGMMLCSERQNCSHCLRVPWTMVPIMVKNRTVGISKGEAEIRCQDLLQLLCSVFQETLEFGIKQLSLYGGDLFEDKRLSSVKKSLCKVYRRIQSNGMTLQRQNLTHRDIEIEAPFFPLCMQQLHSILLRNNRLRHHERFKYTLFLKDVGLPLAENIRFWEDFYSKPHCTSTSGCTHSWAGNDRNRYMYSIKHLYGLEGGRKNYASHSCSSLQACHPQPTEIRGCPFTSTDAEEVSTLIKKFVPRSANLLDNVMKEVLLGRPSAACQLVFAFQVFIQKQSSQRCRSDAIRKTADNLSKRENVGNTLTLSNERKELQDISMQWNKDKGKWNPKADLPSLSTKDCNRNNMKVAFRSENIKHDCKSKKDCTSCHTFSTVLKANSEHISEYQDIMSCDIEDLGAFLPACSFSRPSQYYLSLKHEQGFMHTSN